MAVRTEFDAVVDGDQLNQGYFNQTVSVPIKLAILNKIRQLQDRSVDSSAAQDDIFAEAYTSASGRLSSVSQPGDTDDAEFDTNKYKTVEADASYASKSFSVTSQESSPFGMFVGNLGTKLYVVGIGTDTIYQYTLSTAWDISTASYDSKSKSISAEDTFATNVFFKSDGLKMYAVGYQNNRVYQYTLGTAWDVSTATYDSVNFSVQTEQTSLYSVFFKDDGTKMYITGPANNTVFQYTLGTAWNLATASYDSVSFNASSQDSFIADMFFKPDGTKLYLSGSTGDNIYQYSLGTAWDLSTATYDSLSFSVASEDLTPRGLFFKDDGTTCYVLGQSNDTIYQYTLPVVWVVSYPATSYITHILPAGTFASNISSAVGAPLFEDFETGADAKFKLSSQTYAWNTSVISPDSKTVDVSAEMTHPHGIYMKSDGLKMYICDFVKNFIYQYTLGTAWDISTASYDSKSLDVDPPTLSPSGVWLKDDGTEIYFMSEFAERIYKSTLGTAWDISTAGAWTLVFNFQATANSQSPFSFYIRDDGLKCYIASQEDTSVTEYTLSTAWDFTTIAASGNIISVGTQEASTVRGLFFRDDGKRMFICGSVTEKIFQYTLSTAWDVSSATYDNISYDLSALGGAPTGIWFKPDGQKLYVVGYAGDLKVNQYSSALIGTGDDSGWINKGEIANFTAFTGEPNTLEIQLIPTDTDATTGYPSIKGFGVYTQ